VSSAYGHAIAAIGAGGLDSSKYFHVTRTEVRQVLHWDPAKRAAGELLWLPYCKGWNCPEKPEYVTRYFYVTGRAGRVTDRIQYCCRKHGEAFAKKHGLTLAANEVRPVDGGASAEANAGECRQLNTQPAFSGPEGAAVPNSVEGQEFSTESAS
jgi:hypothetical protein